MSQLRWHTGLWLLDSITGSGGSSVKLTYGIELGAVANSQGPTLAIDLLEIDYNPHPTASCFKNQIILGYEPAASGAPPLSLSVLGPTLLARKHKLDSVDVSSRATCGASPTRLRHYSLQYAPDPDTGLQRLSGVKVSGRDGTPEMNTNISLASYTYGTATSVDSSGARTLQYLPDLPIPFPSSSSGQYLSNTALVGGALFQAPVAGTGYASLQSFTDFTGDGRPDLVFTDQNGQLQIARNQAIAGNAATFTAIAPFTDSTATKKVLDARSATVPRFSKTSVDSSNEEYVWRQAIDVNGDGRMDFIDAAETPNPCVPT